MSEQAQPVDVLIVGAGVSGIGAACRLARECPGKSVAILERRAGIGGTWDLFRYPGIRSDSDMLTFGYDFRPWTDPQTLAPGDKIRNYVRETAAEYGVDKLITYGVRVRTADWSSADALWTVQARDEASGETRSYTARFLLGCTGYYDYDTAYRPHFAGEQRYAGTLVHPQFWPEDLDYRGRRVVVIGSGATAVTLVPAMADQVEHITMVQRSPSYILSLPAVDQIGVALRKILPAQAAYRAARAKNIWFLRATYRLAQRRPRLVRRIIEKAAARQLAGTSEIANFQPRYDPWDQRLCVIPDGDLFAAIRAGKAEIVTDTIETFTETGLRLTSGRELTADIVITATGLTVQTLGGAELLVDGTPVQVNQTVTYKGVLLSGVPNAAMIFGYINASWTLKADLAAEYVCRLLNHMDATGADQAVVHAGAADVGPGSVFGALVSGYVKRGEAYLPRQGAAGPWRVSHDYKLDAKLLRTDPIDDGVLEFARRPAASTTRSRPAAHARPHRPLDSAGPGRGVQHP